MTEREKWIKALTPGFFVRGATVEDAADACVKAGLTVAEYHKRDEEAHDGERLGLAPPSILLFSRTPDGLEARWAE